MHIIKGEVAKRLQAGGEFSVKRLSLNHLGMGH